MGLGWGWVRGGGGGLGRRVIFSAGSKGDLFFFRPIALVHVALLFCVGTNRAS